MFINKAEGGKNNLCGGQIARLRVKLGVSQKKLADMLQLKGLDVDKNAIQRIEAGKRFVTDIELVYFSELFRVSLDELLNSNPPADK